MAFPFTEEHLLVREAARGWLEDWFANGARLKVLGEEKGCARQSDWHDFAIAQGFAGLMVKEEHGGAGLGRLGAVSVLEEMGRCLFNGPFAASAVSAAYIIERLAPQSTLAAEIAQGKVVIAVDARILSVDKELSGSIGRVTDTELADTFLIICQDGDHIVGLVVPSDSPNIAVEFEERIDISRSYATVSFNSVNHAERLFNCSRQDIEEVLAITQAMDAAQLVGAAHACLDLVLSYADQRVQFGRKISSYQAIKHRCADLYIQLETARSAVYMAAASEAPAAYETALIASAYARQAFYDIAADAIQLHGGIGFTWEYPLQYYFKRARASLTIPTTLDATFDALADCLEA